MVGSAHPSPKFVLGLAWDPTAHPLAWLPTAGLAWPPTSCCLGHFVLCSALRPCVAYLSEG